ncbi:uncharacterized protein LOC144165357 [Haemaphysalis longicornis]
MRRTLPTSSGGKVMERMVLRRHQGLRQHLSLQDVIVQLHELVIKKAPSHVPRGILARDLKGALAIVSHWSVLENLCKTGCGSRMYGYIKDFLTKRMAIICIEGERLEPTELRDRDTPQGLVLSPQFFNMALRPCSSY